MNETLDRMIDGQYTPQQRVGAVELAVAEAKARERERCDAEDRVASAIAAWLEREARVGEGQHFESAAARIRAGEWRMR